MANFSTRQQNHVCVLNKTRGFVSVLDLL